MAKIKGKAKLEARNTDMLQTLSESKNSLPHYGIDGLDNWAIADARSKIIKGEIVDREQLEKEAVDLGLLRADAIDKAALAWAWLEQDVDSLGE